MTTTAPKVSSPKRELAADAAQHADASCLGEAQWCLRRVEADLDAERGGEAARADPDLEAWAGRAGEEWPVGAELSSRSNSTCPGAVSYQAS